MMKKFILLTAVYFFVSHPVFPEEMTNPAPPVKSEFVQFHWEKFSLSGELRVPDLPGKHPLIMMIHGSDSGRFYSYLKLKCFFNRMGIATLIWDRPGSGFSSGKLTPGKVLGERAGIVCSAVAFAMSRKNIDSGRIGCWGISQGAFVLPMAAEKCSGIKFLILVSGGESNGIVQSGYQVRAGLLCEGFSRKEAETAEGNYIRMMKAQTYGEYLKYIRPLIAIPLVQKMGFAWKRPWEKKDWIRREPGSEVFFDPSECVKRLDIPVLAIFGELDKMVNGVYGFRRYSSIFSEKGDGVSRAVLLAGADHSMVVSKTGCMKERSQRSGKEWENYVPEYLAGIRRWLNTVMGNRIPVEKE